MKSCICLRKVIKWDELKNLVWNWVVDNWRWGSACQRALASAVTALDREVPGESENNNLLP